MELLGLPGIKNIRNYRQTPFPASTGDSSADRTAIGGRILVETKKCLLFPLIDIFRPPNLMNPLCSSVPENFKAGNEFSSTGEVSIVLQAVVKNSLNPARFQLREPSWGRLRAV